MEQAPKNVLTNEAHELLGGNLADMSLDRLHLLITLTQHATDLLLNEIKRRGELTSRPAAPPGLSHNPRQ